jgi:hypothetical protein
MALHRLGGELPRAALPVADGGVSMQAMRDAARARGFAAFVVRGTLQDLRDNLAKGRSVVIGLHKPFRDGVRHHYELVVGWHERGQYVLTVDPARGFTRNDLKGFVAEWEPAGRPLLLIAPAAATSKT